MYKAKPSQKRFAGFDKSETDWSHRKFHTIMKCLK